MYWGGFCGRGEIYVENDTGFGNLLHRIWRSWETSRCFAGGLCNSWGELMLPEAIRGKCAISAIFC